MASKLAPKEATPVKAESIKATPVKSRTPTAATRRALADLKAGRLTRYASVAHMFEKLGVKVGKP